MVFYLVAVGRMRDAALRTVAEVYAQRARRHIALTIREVAEAGRRAARPDEAPQIEGRRLQRAVPDGARQIALTRVGDALPSRAFAAQVARWREDARDVAFLIGGAMGLAPELLAGCERRLSLSSLTLPHELARVVFLEQLYRATTILRGEPYHKGPA